MKKDDLIGLVLGGLIMGVMTLSPKGPTTGIKIRDYKSDFPVKKEIKKERTREYCSTDLEYVSPVNNVSNSRLIGNTCPDSAFNSAIYAMSNGEWTVTNISFYK